MKPSDLSEFFNLLGKAKKEKEEEFDNLLKEADINLDDLTSSLVSGIKEAKEDQKKQKKKEEKLIEQLDSIIDVIENPKEVKDITEPAVTVGVPEDFDVTTLEDADDNETVEIIDIVKPEPIKTPEISDTVAQAIKFIEETNIKEEIENSDDTNLDKLKTEIKQVRDILYKVLAHGPGSGEVNLLKLDDVDEDSAKVDGKFLKYDASSGKFVGGSGGAGSQNLDDTLGLGNTSVLGMSVGVITATSFVGDGSQLTNIGSASTANVRTGILDVTGIATFRSDTLIGSGVTLSPDGDVFTTGVTTSTTFVGDLTGDVTGDATGLSGTPSITVNAVNGATGTFTTGVTTSLRTNKISLGDDEFINVGLGSDLKIYHDPDGVYNEIKSSNGNIRIRNFDTDGARRAIYIQSEIVQIRSHTNNHAMISATAGAQIDLYYNNTKRLETTNTGAKVTGDLEITGALTYEDVTNVDSVGVITARSGVLVGSGITLSPDGDVFTTGISTFTGAIDANDNLVVAGDMVIGSDTAQAKLDVTAGGVHNAAFLKTSSDKSLIEFENSAGSTYNTRIGSATLGSGNVGLLFETGTSSSRLQAMVIDRYGKVGIGSVIPAAKLDVAGSFNVSNIVNIGAASPTTSDNGQLNVYTTTSGGKAQFVHSAGFGGVRLAGTAAASGASLVFSNNYNSGTFSDHWTIQHGGSDDSLKFLIGGTGGTEAFRIDSSGRLLLGTTTEGHANADDLTIATSGDTGITIRSGTTHNGRIYFSDATSGAGEFVGSLDYDHNINKFSIITNGESRLKIDSNGRVLIGTDTEGHPNADDLTIATSGDTGITIRSGTTNNGRIYFSDATSGAGEVVGSLDYDHNINKFSIITNGESRLHINGDGGVGISSNLTVSGISTFNNTVKIGTGVTALSDGNVSIGGTFELFNTTGDALNNPSEIKISNLTISQHNNTGTYKLNNSSFGGEILLSAGAGGFGGLSFWNKDFSRLYFMARDQGFVSLYYNNTVRFKTSGIGATVYGQLDTTSNVNVGSGITLSPDGDIFATGISTLGNSSSSKVIIGNPVNLPTLAASTKIVAADMAGNDYYVDISILGGRTGRSMLKFGDQDSKDVGAISYYHSDDAIVFKTNGTDDRLRITSSGQVGIGTDNPYYNLQVNFDNSDTSLSGGTNGNWGSAGLRLENENTTVGSMSLVHFRTGNHADWHIGGKFVGSNSSNFVFIHEGSEKLRITNTGDVGIGSDSPTTKLDVIGDFSLKSTDSNVKSSIRSGSFGGSNHSYLHGFDGSAPNGLTIRSNEASLEIIGLSDVSGTHACSFLMRDTSNDGFGFVNDPTNEQLQLKSFTTSADNFRINSTGGNVSRLDNCIVITKDGAVETFFDGTKRFETTNTGAKVTGDLEITGVLTYEDVTNVDSVGVITARSGVLVGSGITLSPDGDVFAVGVSTLGNTVNVNSGSGTLMALRLQNNLTGTSVNDGAALTYSTNSSSLFLSAYESLGNMIFQTGGNHMNNRTLLISKTGVVTLQRNEETMLVATPSNNVAITTNFSVSGISTLSSSNGRIVACEDENASLTFISTSGIQTANRYRIIGGGGRLTLKVSANNGASYATAVSVGGIGNIFIPDNDKVYFGTNNDAYIQHDNSNLNVINTTGNIDVTGNVLLNNDLKVGSGVTISPDGNVFTTGISTFTGAVGIGSTVSIGNEDILIRHDPDMFGDIYNEISFNNGNVFFANKDTSKPYMYIRSNDIQLRDWSNNREYIHCANSLSVKLNYNGSQRLKTQSWGVEITNALSANNIVATAADSSFAGSSFTDNVTVGSGITLSPDGDLFTVGVSTFIDNIHLKADSKFIKIGANDDFTIQHNGDNTFLDNGEGQLFLRDDQGVNITNLSNQSSANFYPNDGVYLYFAGNQKLRTTNTGITVTGTAVATAFEDSNGVGINTANVRTGILDVAGVSTFRDRVNIAGGKDLQLLDNGVIRLGNASNTADFQMFHNGSHTYFNNATGSLYIINTTTDGSIRLQPKTGHNGLIVRYEGAVQAYHNNTKRLETTNTGAKVTGDLEITGVLTYEDVTNVDSVGVITARSGVLVGSGITLSPDGDVFATGVTTTSSLVTTGRGSFNSLGVGTTNPSAPLHISGADAASARLIIEDNNNNIAASDIRVQNGGRDLRIAANNDIIFTRLADSIPLLYLENGNAVGIATANPSAKLDVFGNTKLRDTVDIDGTATFNGDVNVGDATITNPSGSSLDFSGSITASDVITAGALLHEGDTDTLVHFSAADTIDFKTFGVARLRVNNSGVSLQNNVTFNINGGRLIFGDSTGGTTDDRIVLGNDNDCFLYHDSTNTFIENNTGILKILGDNIQLGEGSDKVGIGTDTLPTQGQFFVGVQTSSNNYDTAPTVRFAAETNAATLGDVSSVHIGQRAAGSADPAIIFHRRSGDVAWKSWSGRIHQGGLDNFTFGFSAPALPGSHSYSTDMVIKRNVGVGIGTESPSTSLHTFSTGAAHVVLHESGPGQDCRLRIRSQSNKFSQLEFADDDADAGEIRYDHVNDAMSFHVNANTERLRILSSGHTRIENNQNALADLNTRTSYHLHISNPQNDVGEAVGICFGLSTGRDIGASIYHSRSGSNSFGDLMFATKPDSGSVTERVRIESAGNVNIEKNLNVVGVVTATTFSGNLSGGTVSGTTGTFTNNLSVAQNIVHTGDTDTKIEFTTDTISFETGGTERARFNSNGLCLGGTGAANGLDDYEEGTFTPSYSTSNNDIGTVQHDVQTGRYTKIGRMVYFTLRLRTDSISSVGTGTIKITGFPFTHVNQSNHRAVTHNIYSANWLADKSPTLALFIHNQSALQLYKKDFNNDSSGLAAASLSTEENDNDIRITGMYETSQ